jgi:type IV secretory pathway VirB4 component
MLVKQRSTALRRELTAPDRIAYTAHVAPGVVRTSLGEYLQMFRLAGTRFGSTDDEELSKWHERLKSMRCVH